MLWPHLPTEAIVLHAPIYLQTAPCSLFRPAYWLVSGDLKEFGRASCSCLARIAAHARSACWQRWTVFDLVSCPLVWPGMLGRTGQRASLESRACQVDQMYEPLCVLRLLQENGSIVSRKGARARVASVQLRTGASYYRCHHRSELPIFWPLRLRSRFSSIMKRRPTHSLPSEMILLGQLIAEH